METAQEKVFFQDERVLVTQSRFVADGKTYAMRNISSVSNFKISKSRVMPVLLTMIGVLLLFSQSARLFGFVVAAAGVFWWISIKDEYSVRINSNSGESNGLVSTDGDYVQQIVDAVSDAIIFRG